MNHDIPARSHEPPPESEELELPESLAKARWAIEMMELAGIGLAEDNLLRSDEEEEQWLRILDEYAPLLRVAEERAVELAENQGRDG